MPKSHLSHSLLSLGLGSACFRLFIDALASVDADDDFTIVAAALFVATSINVLLLQIFIEFLFKFRSNIQPIDLGVEYLIDRREE